MPENAFVTTPSSRRAEAALDLVDAGPEDGKVLLERRQITLEDLAASALVHEQRLDPTEGVGDRLILLLEALDPPVELVEVAEDLRAQLLDLPLDRLERRSIASNRPSIASNRRSMAAKRSPRNWTSS